MSSKLMITALAAFFTTLLMSGAAVGQSAYGEMYGSFTDASGVPVAGARVTVTSQGRGSDLTTTTNEFGKFQASGLLPDTYTIEVEEDGFKTFRETEIPVVADETSRVSGILTKGDPTTFITGTPGKIDILKTDRTDVSSLFTRRTIEGLPLRDLNVSRLGLLVPGSLPAILRLDPNQNPQNGTPINVNGQSFSGTGFQLDGTDNRDPLLGLVLINPNLESVSEMKVTTQNYGADFGEATAGVISIQTRSGTNSWHGSAFDYRRTAWGQATNPFSTPPPPIKHNDFGGSIGGPLVKNRLFFFGDYQGTRQTTHFNPFKLSVPTQLVHQTCVGGPSGFCDLHEYLSVGQVYDPKNDVLYAPNQVPNATINPGAVGLLGLLPLPNAGNPGEIVNNFVATGARVFGADRFDTRVDLNASRKLKLLARYSLANFRDDGSPAFGKVAGGAGTKPRGFAGRGRTHNQGLSSGFVYSVTPTLLTDFRFGFFRYHLNLDSFDLGTTPALSIANTPGLNNPNELFSSGLPDIELEGTSGTDYLRFGYSPLVNSCNCPFREYEQRFQWVTNWMKTFGKHAFKWGADIRYYENFRLTSDHRRAGHLLFNAETTGDINGQGGLSLASFLFGAVSAFDRLYVNPANRAALNAGERQKRWFFYGQDTWRVTPHLTINYGLRWEIYFPQTVTASGAGGILIPNFATPASSIFNVPDDRGVDRSGNVKNNLTNFGPRFGIAYLISPKTVIRAGYGRGFDVGIAGSNFGISATQNPPVMFFQSVSNNLAPPRPAPVFFLGETAPAPTFATIPSSSFSIRDLTNTFLGNGYDVLNQTSVYAVPARIRLPTVDAWNFTVQRQLSSTMYFEVGYVGNKGTHVPPDGTGFAPSTYDLNQATLNGYIIAGNSNNNPACKAGYSGNFCVSKAASRKPFRPWVGPVRYFGNDASNNYNSLQAKLNKSFSQGYEFLAHYTWGKALNYESSYFNVDPTKAKMGYGPANFDRSHVFVLANLWSLPVGRGKPLLANAGPMVDRIVGGWAINAVAVWYSGLPFSPSYSTCGQDRDTGPCRPNVVGDVHILGKRKEWFTTTGGIPFDAAHRSTFDPSTGDVTAGPRVGPWQEPKPGTFGNAGRNSLRGPGFFQSDIGISKDIAFTERISLRFRADVFNAFNRVNLGNPNSCVDCARNAAAIQQLAPGAFQRQWQFSLKLQF
jgi:Carboxypeptidase regulatory-like domain/TonB dependent receptor-like, beta-barrel